MISFCNKYIAIHIGTYKIEKNIITHTSILTSYAILHGELRVQLVLDFKFQTRWSYHSFVIPFIYRSTFFYC